MVRYLLRVKGFSYDFMTENRLPSKLLSKFEQSIPYPGLNSCASVYEGPSINFVPFPRTLSKL